MPRYFLLQRRRLLPSEHRLWAALWTARCLVFNPIFIVSTHLSLGLGLGPASMGMEMQMEMGMWKVHFHWNSSSSNHNNKHNNKGNFMFNSLK